VCHVPKRCDVSSKGAISSSRSPTSHQRCPIIIKCKSSSKCNVPSSKGQSSWKRCHILSPSVTSSCKGPTSSREGGMTSQSSGGDDLHESVLVAPQYPPKDPSVNQACGYVQSIIRGGAHVVQCIMKTRGKVHNSNTTYKVSHVNAKSIR
jgi:hypothetical protein